MAQQSSPVRTLPIFRARPRSFDAVSKVLLSTLFGGVTVDRVEHPDRVVFQSGQRQLEVDKRTSALWFVDNSRLWAPLDVAPSLPAVGRATSLANQLAEAFANPWRVVDQFSIRREPLAEESTMVATGGRGAFPIDRHASSRFVIAVSNPWDAGSLDIPIAGRTARTAATVNPGGDLIGAQYSWWDLEYVDHRPVVHFATQLHTLLPELQGLLVDGVTSSLVYHEVEVESGQWWLVPMWMVSPTALLDGRSVPLMTSLVPATDVPGRPPRSEPVQTRDTKTTLKKAKVPPDTYVAGLSWIGSAGRLYRTYESIARVEEVLKGHGWEIGFDWGNRLAHEADWHANSSQWIDAVDFGYFCGHAASDGWTLGDARLTFGDLGTAGSQQPGRYGSDRLRWIVLDACGPLQDPATGASDETCAVVRWGGMFDGLRVLMAGATKLNVSDAVGERFAQLAVDCPLIDAWFRANSELRPNQIGHQRVWVGALYAKTAQENARHDRLPVPKNGQPPSRVFPDPSVEGVWIAL
jgi:hypothetical protein